MKRVVVSGYGVVSPYGVGQEALWQNVSTGVSAVKAIERFDASALQIRFAAGLRIDEDGLDAFVEKRKSCKTLARAGKFLIIAAQEAFERAGMTSADISPYDIGTCFGAGGLGDYDVEIFESLKSIYLRSVTAEESGYAIDSRTFVTETYAETHPLAPLKSVPNIPTSLVSQMFNAKGNSMTLTTACVSSAQAIGEAFLSVRSGRQKMVVCGGADSMVNPNCITMFSMLGVLSRSNDYPEKASKPFSRDRNGFVLGEGAAVFVLEEMNHCLQRGVTPIAEVIGYGSTADAYRLTDPSPDSEGTIRAIRQSIELAGIEPQEVDYINAHGTGTEMNDKHETYAIKQVFGDAAYSIPISSTKSMFGHGVAAAGALEFATCLLSMRHGVITPTINYETPDPECDLDYCPNVPRKKELKTVLSNSFGFGGQNVCLIMRRI